MENFSICRVVVQFVFVRCFQPPVVDSGAFYTLKGYVDSAVNHQLVHTYTMEDPFFVVKQLEYFFRSM